MRSLVFALVALGLGTAPIAVQPVPSAAARPQSVPVADLVRQVDIPHESFTLANGLRVIVHTDRKAPVVAVSVWYDVGSKHEPKGKTGFAHLFEHLMFNGSENADGDFFKPLEELGATDFNGTTWFDRTNYYQTVPTGGLERVLFLESDRMGRLLGAVTQEKLANQIGVVQNEKRQGDNQPFGLVEYAKLAATIPADHPYGHSTIGSMADLDAASLDDVRAWFRQHYGPNNAVIALAGDIDVATARPLMEKWFGAIPAGPKQAPLKVAIPTLSAPKFEVMKDQVATVRLYRIWAVPGDDSADNIPLSVGTSVLGGLASSRLDNALVRQEQLAVAVSASYEAHAQLGWIEVTADVKPGVDPALVGQRLDALLADYLKSGPTQDEVNRVATRTISSVIGGLEQVGGKASTLAEGALLRGDSDAYKKDLAGLATVRPETVKTAMQTWLSRPVYALTVEPGARAAYEESQRPAQAAAAPNAAPPPVVSAPAAKIEWPAVGAVADLDFPKVERTQLKNGIRVIYAQRSAVPVTHVSMSFDAGHMVDPRDAPGTQALMLALLDEGAGGLSSTQIAETEERLGAGIGASASMDRTVISLSALSANLEPSADLFATIIQKPDFAPAEVERLRAQQLARISSELKDPQSTALRLLPPLLYGPGHPYGVSFTGSGDLASVAKINRDALVRFQQSWLRPDKATIFVVSDQPLARVAAVLDQRFGTWQVPGPAGIKPGPAPASGVSGKIYLIDRPGSPQSVILAGQVLPKKGSDPLETLVAANQALGGGFLSRINMDLRETKGWSYGVSGWISRVKGDVPYMILAPVQADRTGDSIAALRANYRDFLSTKGITAEERDRIVKGSVLELPGSFEAASDVLGALQRNDLYGRPDDYYDSLASKYKAMTIADMDAALRGVLQPDRFLWVVVGDAKIVRPQLEKLGLPTELITASGAK
ncbi:MAG: M16 family metallopeptidase [Chakrabartia sp.]